MLLACAAVATAWSSYQATRWNGEVTKTTGRVNAARIEAARAQGLAEGQTQVDIAMFFEWVNATATDDERAGRRSTTTGSGPSSGRRSTPGWRRTR